MSAAIAAGVSHRAAELSVGLAAGASALHAARATAPLKLLVPRPRGTAVWSYLANLGGGLVDGDAIELEVSVGGGATALLATQASTKVYRGRASQTLRARVGEGASLLVVPDPVCCFAGAGYAQRQTFHLARGASLILVDGLSAGRVARGERWGFDSYRSHNEVWIDGELALRDALLLEETPIGPGVAERMGAMNALATVVLLGPAAAPIAVRALDQIAALPAAPADLLATASPLRDGAILRVAGAAIERVAAFVKEQLDGVAALLGADPFLRRP